MSDRALAHVERVGGKNPITGYDRVELATVLGWNVIVSKADQLEVGDKVIYVEIDSKVPETDERWAFLAKRHYKVKTIKMCGVYSQGLIVPISLFPEIADKEVGTDVTKELGITYANPDDNVRKAEFVDKRTWWQKLLNKFGFGKKPSGKKFPTKFEFVHKTDEPRCLVANSHIQTDEGILRIGDIVNKHLSVKVKTVNLDTGLVEYKDILGYQKFACNEPTYLLRYKVQKYKHIMDGLECTGDHMINTPNGYVCAKDIHVGDEVYTHAITYSEEDIGHLLGMVIGDCSVAIEKRKLFNGSHQNGVRLSFTQGEKQLDYLIEKLRLFDCKDAHIHQGKSGYCDNSIYSSYLPVDTALTNFLNDSGCIDEGKFHITKKFCDKMSVIGLTLWYLDDGSLTNRSGVGRSPWVRFSTNSETFEEVELLREMLRDRFNINSIHAQDNHGDGRVYESITVHSDETVKLLEMITPYIPYSMRYKTLPRLETVPYVLQDTVFRRKDRIVPTVIESIEIIRHDSKHSHGKFVYDIEVEDNHNFFSDNILVHNCENIPGILKDKEPWIKTQKIDGTSSTYILEKKPFGRYEYYVCSRSVRQLDRKQKNWHNEKGNTERNVYWDMSDKYRFYEFLKDYINKNNLKYACLQGEIAGPNLQGNPHKFKEVCFFGYNLIRSDTGRISSLEAREICDKYDIPWVPIADTHYILPDDMESVKLDADGECIVGQGLREGWVCRSQDGRKSFKNVSRKYLLKHGG